MKQRSLPLILLKTTLVSYILTAILLFVVAYLLYAMRLSGKQMSAAVNAIYILSCLIGGFLLGKIMGGKRLIWGIVQGVLYMVVLFLLSIIIGRGICESFLQALVILAICCVSSIVGAVMS